METDLLTVAVVATLIGDLLAILAVLWRGATILAELRSETQALREITADHESRHDKADGRLNSHGERIASLEAHPPRRSPR